MKHYNCQGTCTAGATKSAIHLLPTTAVRPLVYEVIIGSAATPAAQAALWSFSRTTAAGTGSPGTIVKFDPAEPDSVCTVAINHSVEPTYSGGSVLAIPLNQQGSFNWKANVDAEIVLPASASAGGGLQAFTSTGTAVHQVSLMWKE